MSWSFWLIFALATIAWAWDVALALEGRYFVSFYFVQGAKSGFGSSTLSLKQDLKYNAQQRIEAWKMCIVRDCMEGEGTVVIISWRRIGWGLG